MEFILRKHSEDAKEVNRVIGNHYSIVRKDCNEQEFNAEFKTYFGIAFNKEIEYFSDDYKNTFAFISFNSGTELIALSHSDNIYIMTDSGKTFTNLTLKRK